jgi:Tfp pilus assembly protein FimT
MVMVLIGILSFTAVPLLTNTHLVNLDGATRKLEADLQYTQSLATTTGDSYGFRTTVSATNSTYEIYRVSDNTVTTSPYHHGQMQEDFADEFGEISFFSDCTVTFDNDGIPTFVVGTSPITIQNSDGDTQTISINSSGLIRKE